MPTTMGREMPMQRAVPMKRGYADTAGGQIHYVACGEGPPLLLLHPTGLSARGYRHLMASLPGFRIHAPDMPGFGYSDPLSRVAGVPVTMEGLADGVADFLDAVGIASTHLFGAHLGNKIGVALAARHPARVGRCVFAGHTHSLIISAEHRTAAFPGQDTIAGAVAAAAHAGDDAAAEGRADRARWAALLSEVLPFWLNPWMFADSVAPGTYLEQAEDEVLCRILCDRSFGTYYGANFAFDMAASLARIAAPTLVIELAIAAEAHLGAQAPSWERMMRDCRSVTLATNLRDLLYRDHATLARHIAAFLSG